MQTILTSIFMCCFVGCFYRLNVLKESSKESFAKYQLEFCRVSGWRSPPFSGCVLFCTHTVNSPQQEIRSHEEIRGVRKGKLRTVVPHAVLTQMKTSVWASGSRVSKSKSRWPSLEEMKIILSAEVAAEHFHITAKSLDGFSCNRFQNCSVFPACLRL